MFSKSPIENGPLSSHVGFIKNHANTFVNKSIRLLALIQYEIACSYWKSTHMITHMILKHHMDTVISQIFFNAIVTIFFIHSYSVYRRFSYSSIHDSKCHFLFRVAYQQYFLLFWIYRASLISSHSKSIIYYNLSAYL